MHILSRGTDEISKEVVLILKAYRASGQVSPVPILKPLRNALYLFAWQSTLSEPWALEYYQRKRAAGKSHSVAVRALSNVWVRILYAIWLTSTPYDRAAFVAAKQLHTSRTA